MRGDRNTGNGSRVAPIAKIDASVRCGKHGERGAHLAQREGTECIAW